MLTISVSSLFFYHLFLTAKNQTTLGEDKTDENTIRTDLWRD